MCRAARAAAAGRCRTVTALAVAAVALAAVVPARRVAVVGAGAGAAAGLVSYLAPHAVAAAIAAVGGLCTAVAAQVGGWAHRRARALGIGGGGG